MTTSSRHNVTVTIHQTADGGFAVGCRTSRWTRGDRLDLRLASIHPLRAVPPCPEGVPDALWWALNALQQRADDLARARQVLRRN